MTQEQMFVSKLLLSPSRLVPGGGGVTDAVGALAANPRSGADPAPRPSA